MLGDLIVGEVEGARFCLFCMGEIDRDLDLCKTLQVRSPTLGFL